MQNRQTNTELGDNGLAIGKGQQWVGMGLGPILAGLIAGSGYFLWKSAPCSFEATARHIRELLVWTFLGGLLGGAGRSLRGLLFEWGGHAKGAPRIYYDKWFVYLGKPLVGVIGGLSFLLLVNLGLVKVFAGNNSTPHFGFLQVMLASVSGGLFFEDVFDRLRLLVVNGSS